MQKIDFRFTDHPEYIGISAVVHIHARRNAPILCGLDKIAQLIRRADRTAGIQLPPTHTERTSKDFRHELILLDVEADLTNLRTKGDSHFCEALPK